MESDYIKKILNGDYKSCSYFIEKYKDLAFFIALKIVKNEQDAEEIVQDSFVKAFRSLTSFKQNSKFSTWFYRITYNTAISRSRLKIIKTENLSDKVYGCTSFSVLNDAIDNLTHQDSIRYINKALNKLDELDFTILTLYYYEDKDLREIAEITNLKVSYINLKLQRARHKLYKELSENIGVKLESLL